MYQSHTLPLVWLIWGQAKLWCSYWQSVPRDFITQLVTPGRLPMLASTQGELAPQQPNLNTNHVTSRISRIDSRQWSLSLLSPLKTTFYVLNDGAIQKFARWWHGCPWSRPRHGKCSSRALVLWLSSQETNLCPLCNCRTTQTSLTTLRRFTSHHWRY